MSIQFSYLFCEIYNNYEQDVNELVPYETVHAINADARTILIGKILRPAMAIRSRRHKKHHGLGLDKKS
jgi:hypothetical protein